MLGFKLNIYLLITLFMKKYAYILSLLNNITIKNFNGGSHTTKPGEIIHYASYLTLIFILFSVLSPSALAGNGAGAGNADRNGKSFETFQKTELLQEKNQEKNQNENLTRGQKQPHEEVQERKQLKEKLNTQKNNYQNSRKNFLIIRSRLRAGNYNEKDLETTREYLNASIDYMIAHLEKVQYNLEQSNGSGTEARINAIEERISQLQEEKKAIEKAEDLEDFTKATESVRGVWNNVKNRTAVETGQTAGEKIDDFANKSESISKKLEKELDKLNETGVNTSELESKLENYNALMASARKNSEAAKEIYNKENATEEELSKANGYLQNALGEIKEANQVLKEIFEELEQYRSEETNRNRARNNPEPEFDDAKNGTENESENSTEEELES